MKALCGNAGRFFYAQMQKLCKLGLHARGNVIINRLPRNIVGD
jgi:hypothetical protein